MLKIDELKKSFIVEKGEVRAVQNVYRHRGRTIFHAAGAERLRQEHDVTLHCRSGTAGGRRNLYRRSMRILSKAADRSSSRRAADRHGFSILRDLAAHGCVSQRGFSLAVRQPR